MDTNKRILNTILLGMAILLLVYILSLLSNSDNSLINAIGFIIVVIVLFFIGMLWYVIIVISSKRGRDTVFWIIMSFIISPILVILILLCLGETKDKYLERKRNEFILMKEIFNNDIPKRTMNFNKNFSTKGQYLILNDFNQIVFISDSEKKKDNYLDKYNVNNDLTELLAPFNKDNTGYVKLEIGDLLKDGVFYRNGVLLN